jgi:hypothetical protein
LLLYLMRRRENRTRRKRTIYRRVAYEWMTLMLNEFAPFTKCNLSHAPIAEGWGHCLNKVVMTLSLKAFESATTNVQVAFVMSEQELQEREFQRMGLRYWRWSDTETTTNLWENYFAAFPIGRWSIHCWRYPIRWLFLLGYLELPTKAGNLLTREAVSQDGFPSVRGEVATDPRTISFIKTFCKVTSQKQIDVTMRHKRILSGVETGFF